MGDPFLIFFFTVPTLRRLLEKNRFEVLRVDLVGRTLTLERLAYNIGVIFRHDRLKRWLSAASTRLRLDHRQSMSMCTTCSGSTAVPCDRFCHRRRPT